MNLGDSGVLRLLVHASTHDKHAAGPAGVGPAGAPVADLFALAWDGTPSSFSWCGRDVFAGDVDLGDYTCEALPGNPHGPGLWLLAWAWRVVAYGADDELLADDAVASAPRLEYHLAPRYAPACEWRRPTLDELRAFGMLPPGVTPDDGDA